MQNLSQGFHTIYMRVKSSNAEYSYSPITTAKFIKFAASGEAKLEYWFDDDISNTVSIPINIDSSAEQVINLDQIDAMSLPNGAHKISMRVTSGDGRYSPVYSTCFMRMLEGNSNYITYWLDDDYANRHRVMATASNGRASRFKTRLNLASVSPGVHRLRYRVSTKEVDNGPIYEEAILVTKKYNSNTDVTVVNQSYWLDEANTSIYAIPNPQEVVTRSYMLDPVSYSDGQHVFHVMYQNSAEVWSEQNLTYFYKDPATGKLRAGMMPDEVTGIDDVSATEHTSCYYRNGTIIIDCQSPKLADTGNVYLCDISGRIITQQSVSNSNGIHAEISVDGLANQMLIVKLVCGGINYKQKIMVK